MLFEWQGNQPVTLQCIDKYAETPDCTSIKLAPTAGATRFEFKPGQFINLGVEINGKTQFRAYSISSQTLAHSLLLTIKRVPQGQVSNFIIDSLAIGDTVQALPPTGDFNCIDHPPQHTHNQAKALLISAGCGITPVFAMAQYWLTHQPSTDIAFMHIARSPQETIYLDQLQTYEAAYEQFHLHLLLKDRGTTSYTQGRLDAKWLQEQVPDLHQRTVYLCGPERFMQDVQRYLETLAFDMNHCYYERFSPATSAQSETLATSPSSTQVNVYVAAYEQPLATSAGALLADVLEQAQLPIVMACRNGICGSCKCKVHQGNVVSTSQAPLTPEEIEQGYVLACSSTITSDLEISIG